MKPKDPSPLLAFDAPLTDDVALDYVTESVARIKPNEAKRVARVGDTGTQSVLDDLAPAAVVEERRETPERRKTPSGRKSKGRRKSDPPPTCQCAIYQTCDVCGPIKAQAREAYDVAQPVVVERIDGDDASLVDATPPQIESDAPLQYETDGAQSDHFQLTAPPSDMFSAEHVIETAFKHFRALGFPYRSMTLHCALQELNKLARTPQSALLHTTAAYQVADSYNPHRFHAAAEKMKSPIESFADDAKLRHALKLQLEQSGSIPDGYFATLGIVRGTQACSNFRPGFACLLYREYCAPGSVVLDTSTGYGGRLVGFLASKIGARYIGIDPNTLTHAGNTRMASELGFADVVELHNLPAEDVPHDVVRERCDFSFTSPPYFAKEHYSEEPTQSWKRYGDSFDAWVRGFLQPMLLLTFVALKRDAFALINIADVTLRGKRWPLVQATIDSAKRVGFAHVCTRMFPLNVRVGANQQTEIPYEPVLVFKKR